MQRGLTPETAETFYHDYHFVGVHSDSLNYAESQVNTTTPITVTVADARKLTGLGHTTIWKMISEDELETVCVGRRRLILYDSLKKRLQPTDADTALTVRSCRAQKVSTGP